MNNILATATATANAKERDYCAQGHRDDMIVRHLMQRRLHQAYNSIVGVIDVDANDMFRALDVDLLVITTHNNIVSVEIKVDDYPEVRDKDGKLHKYIFVETVSNDKKGTPGWLYSSAANVFLYYFKKLNRFIMIKSDVLRKYVTDNIDRLQHKTARTFAHDNKTVMYHSHGVLVDVYELDLPLCYFRGGDPYAWAENELIDSGKLEPLTPLEIEQNKYGIEF